MQKATPLFFYDHTSHSDIGIGLDFHDRSSVGYNRSMIDHNRWHTLSSQQHLLAISAAKLSNISDIFRYCFWQKICPGRCVATQSFAVYFDHNYCQILGSIKRNRNPFDPMIDYNRSLDYHQPCNCTHSLTLTTSSSSQGNNTFD